MDGQVSDRQLIERVQSGDQRAFDTLAHRYRRKLCRLLSHFVADPATVEDIAQESLLKAFSALPSFRGDSAFYTWLYRIGVNTAKTYLLAQKRRLTVFAEIDTDVDSLDGASLAREVNTPEVLLHSKQIALTVKAAMDALPQELRMAIVLREIDGLSYEEIAREMACPIGTVRSRIFRAREVIAARLRPLLDVASGHRW